MSEGEVRQVLIHPALWDGFNEWLDRHGLKLAGPVQFSEDDLPTYTVTPKRMGPP